MTSLTFMFVDVPGSGLVHVDRELRRRARRARCAVGRIADRARHRRVDAGHAERGVGHRGVPLDRRQGVGDADVERSVGDREVADRQRRSACPTRCVRRVIVGTPSGQTVGRGGRGDRRRRCAGGGRRRRVRGRRVRRPVGWSAGGLVGGGLVCGGLVCGGLVGGGCVRRLADVDRDRARRAPRALVAPAGSDP